MKKFKKVLIIIFSCIFGLNLLVHIGCHTWQLLDKKAEIPRVLESICDSFYDYENNEKVVAFKEKMGGTARGVCHPQNDEYSLEVIKEANITWVRFDIPSECPYLFDEDTLEPVLDTYGKYQLTSSYLAYKDRCKLMKDAGLKVMGITPYVDDILNDAGLIDVFNNGGEYTDAFRKFVTEISTFYANDLQGYVDCYQISNELDVDKWQGALSREQIVEYLGLQMTAMYPITSQIGTPIGFNVTGLSLYFYPAMVEELYGDYYDYAALDLYLGCFESSYHTTLIFDLLLQNLYHITGKPVMLDEFGYISTGTPKDDEAKAKWLLETYGEDYSTEEKIKANPIGFMDKMKEVTGDESPMYREAYRVYNKAKNDGKTDEEAKNAVNDYIFGDAQIAHIYRSLPDGYYLSKYDHTEQGQADFFYDTVKRLYKKEYICGYFCYMYSDSDACYQCGGEACPVETGWGLVELPYEEINNEKVIKITCKDDIKPKESYYALQKIFGQIKDQEKAKFNLE